MKKFIDIPLGDGATQQLRLKDTNFLNGDHVFIKCGTVHIHGIVALLDAHEPFRSSLIFLENGGEYKHKMINEIIKDDMRNREFIIYRVDYPNKISEYLSANIASYAYNEQKPQSDKEVWSSLSFCFWCKTLSYVDLIRINIEGNIILINDKI